MKLKCVIIDDEINSAHFIKDFVLRNTDLELIGIETETISAMEKLLSKQLQPDLVFLDIRMPFMDGIDFATRIKGLFRIIFITGDETRAVEAFDLDGIDYLIKPITDKRLARAVDKVKVALRGENPQLKVDKDMLIMQEGKKGQYQTIDLKELVFIESSSNYVTFRMLQGKPHVVYMTLNAIEERLSDLGFFRVHKTFIINLYMIKGISGQHVIMKNGLFVNIGPKYKNSFMVELMAKKLL